MTQVLQFEGLIRNTAFRAHRPGRLPTVLDHDDLLQQARLQVLELEQRYDPDRAPKPAWLAASLPWALSRYIRSVSPEHRSTRTKVYSVDPEELLDRADTVTRVDDEAAARVDCQSVLRHLSPLHRSVLWLHFAEGHRPAAIAAALRIPVDQVEPLVKRALRAAHAVVAGRTAPDDAADTALLLAALQEGADTRGRLPGRSWVCKRTGLSELRYHRLMRRLVAEGRVVGRSPRCPGYLADEGGRAA